MELFEQTFSFIWDLGLFLIYSLGYCTSIFFDCILSLVRPITGVTNRSIALFRVLFLIPFRIIIKILLQLFLLPVNVPLKLLLGTSLNQILLHAANWTDGYVFTTILQYWVALMIFGISVGAVCGTSLSVLHSIWKIPDIYIDVPVRFWKRVPSLWEFLKKRLLTRVRDQTQMNIKESTFGGIPQTPPLTPSTSKEELSQPPIVVDSEFSEIFTTPKYKYDPKKWSRPPSVSKDSILKVASRLPSDFFQQGQSNPDYDEEDRHSLSPSRFSQDTTQNSSAEFTNLWDKVGESPTTLRTEDCLATLSRRKKFPGSSEIGLSVDR